MYCKSILHIDKYALIAFTKLLEYVYMSYAYTCTSNKNSLVY